MPQETLPHDDSEPKDPHPEPGPLVQHQLVQALVCHLYPGGLTSLTYHVSVSGHHLLLALQVPGFKSTLCSSVKDKRTTEEVSASSHEEKTKGGQRKHPFFPSTGDPKGRHYANYWRGTEE